MIGIILVSALLNWSTVSANGLRLDGYRLAPPNTNQTTENDNQDVSGSIFTIGHTYDLVLFGEGIGGGQFVLTKTPAKVGSNCNNYGHTNSQYIIGQGDAGSVGLVTLYTSKDRSNIFHQSNVIIYHFKTKCICNLTVFAYSM